MAVEISVNRPLGIRLHKFFGCLQPATFLALANFYRSKPDLAHLDLVSFIDEHAEPDIDIEDIRRIKESFLNLQSSVRPVIVRRSAWVCPNVRAWPLLEHWLHERHSRDAMRIEVCLVAELDEAIGLFDRNELIAIRGATDFEELDVLECPQ